MLSADTDKLSPEPVTTTRLLGPFDLFLQARDRPILVDGEIVGRWRPHKSGKHFRVQIALWDKASAPVRAAITEQAKRLAAYRQVPLSGIDLDD